MTDVKITTDADGTTRWHKQHRHLTKFDKETALNTFRFQIQGGCDAVEAYRTFACTVTQSMADGIKKTWEKHNLCYQGMDWIAPFFAQPNKPCTRYNHTSGKGCEVAKCEFSHTCFLCGNPHHGAFMLAKIITPDGAARVHACTTYRLLLKDAGLSDCKETTHAFTEAMNDTFNKRFPS